jgi:hypothetical protein
MSSISSGNSMVIFPASVPVPVPVPDLTRAAVRVRVRAGAPGLNVPLSTHWPHVLVS